MNTVRTPIWTVSITSATTARCPSTPVRKTSISIPSATLATTAPQRPTPIRPTLDSDDAGDVCDNCADWYNASQEDLDGDGFGDICDNCADQTNSSQADFDFDGEGDHCDVDDGRIFLLAVAPVLFEWDDEPDFALWNCYRGDLEVLKDTGVYTQQPGSNDLASQATDLIESWVNDPDEPAPGQCAFYLITGESAGQESTLGDDSTGSERPNDNPAP